MRIVHLVRSDAWAGVERHVTTLAVAQSGRGDQVTVIGGDPTHVRAALDGHGVAYAPATTVLEGTRALVRAGRPTRPDVVHVHMTAAELAAALAVPLRSVPVVTTRHFGQRRGGSVLTRPLLRLGAHRLGASIAISRYVADHVEDGAVVIHPGVPPLDVDAGAQHRERTVLVAQRLEPEKHTDVAVRAFAEAGVARDGWRLVVAGDGSQRRRLERLTSDLGVRDHVEFLGHRSDVPDLMARHGLFLAPTPAEGLGLSVLEAMAARLPVVAAAGGGHLETAGQVDPGLLFTVGDSRDAARVLSGLAADPARRDELGRRLQESQRASFSPAAQAEATEAVYRSVL